MIIWDRRSYLNPLGINCVLIFLLLSFQRFQGISQSITYDSLAASDTLSWPQMKYLDSLMLAGADWQVHISQLTELGVIQEVEETVERVPEHLVKLDSLLQVKSGLLKERIQSLANQGQNRLDSASQALPFDLGKYTSQVGDLDQLIEEYSGELTSPKELSWLQDHLGQLQQIDGALDQYQGTLMNTVDLGQLQGYQQQLQELTERSQGYFQEAQGLFSEGLKEDSPLMQTLQSKIGGSKEFQQLQAQTAELEQLKALHKKYGAEYASQSRKEAKQRLLDKAQEIGANAFAEHQDKVQEVQDKFSKLKKKYSSLSDARDLSTGVKRSSLKGKPFSERLILGGSMQVSKKPVAADLSPIIGYRIDKKFRLGLGGIYRAQLDFDDMKSQEQVYGWRSFLEYQPLESLFLHGEYESMSALVTMSKTNGEATRRWIGAVLAGIGKEYPLLKGVKGQVMLLYNFTYDHGVSPYGKPWVIRFAVTK